MNYKRLVIIGFVTAIAIFSFYHLTTAGEDYKVLTTSDSGFFFGIARGINQEDGLIENYELSHPPNGKSVSKSNQLHSLMLVSLYRGVRAINPSSELMDVAQYFSPLIFILALIGIFLAGREIGGNIAGCAAMFLMGVNVYLIYWVKMGAFDREPTQLFFIAWSLYFFTKLFKASRKDLIKYSILSGIVFGLFLSAWKGALFMGPALGFALFLILLFELPSKYTSVDKIENAIYHTIRDNIHLIGGVIGSIAVSSIVAIMLGGYSPDFWIGLSNRIAGLLGVAGGGGGLGSPIYAAEQNPPGNLLASLSKNTYNSNLLFNASLALAALGAFKTFIDRKKEHFLLLAILFTTLVMSTVQSRFLRLTWPIWPVAVGLGLVALLGWGEKLMTSPYMITSDWTSKAKQPVVLGLVFVIVVTPLFHNARDNVSDEKISQTYVYPHGSSLNHKAYFDLVSCFKWLKGNSPKDAITAVEWSYGHFLTGYTDRATICDGGQTIGVWNDKTTPPPGIVQKDVDGDGVPDDTDGDGEWERTGEGRRRLVSRLQSSTPEKFAEIIENFKNWGIGIDYMVFDLRKEEEALTSSIENSQKPDNYSVSQQGMIQYMFGDSMVFFTGQQAFIQQDNSYRKLPVVYEVYRRTSQGVRGVHQMPGDFNPKTDIHKTLMLYYRDGGFSKQNQGFVMMDSNIPLATLGEQKIPILTRILNDYKLPQYIEVVHMGSNQKFCVAKINY